jgi:hypothetical protein
MLFKNGAMRNPTYSVASLIESRKKFRMYDGIMNKKS